MVKIRGPLEIAGIEVLGSLPLTENFEGRMVQVGSQIYVFQNGAYDRVSFPPQDPLLTDGAVLVSDGDDVLWLKPANDKQVLGSVLEQATWRDQYPDMGGHEDHILRSDGIDNVIWSPQYPTLLNGKFLTNDGTDVLWGDIPGQLPTPIQGVDDGKYLRYDGTDVLWQAVVRADLEAQTPGYVLINDPAGLMSEEQYLAQVRGGFGADVSVFGDGVVQYLGGSFVSAALTPGDLPSSGILATQIEDGSVDAVEFKRLSEFGRVLSTGIISGGALSINASPALFDLTAGVGEIIDYTVPATPTITTVPFGPFTGVTVTNIATNDVTHVLINSAGSIVQQTTFPTPAQRRDMIYVGRLNHSNRTTISFADNIGGTSQSVANQLGDLMDALGSFNIEGNTPQTNGPNLTLSRGAGTMFSRYFNRVTFPKNPHGIPIAGQTPMQFAYRTQAGGSTGLVTNVDPLNWDNGISPTPVAIPPVPASTAQIQRIYLFPSGETRIQYGQTLYTNLAAALDALPSEVHVKAPTIEGFGILIGYVVVQRNATDLTEADRARVIPASRFDIGVGGGGSVSSTTLQQAYLNGFIPHITLTQTGGGLTVRDASTPLTPAGTPLFRVQDNLASVDYFAVSTAGIIDPVIAPRATNPPYKEGQIWYDSVDKTMRYWNDSLTDSVNIGQEVNFRVRNETGATLPLGTVVRITTGATGSVPLVVKAQADTFANAKAFGVLTESINHSAEGYATIAGVIKDLPTTGLTAGALMYLSPTTPGAVTSTRPTAPNYAMAIGYVAVTDPVAGKFVVHMDTLPELGLSTVAHRVRGMNSGATAEEYKDILGTANQINVTPSAGQIQLSIDPAAMQSTGVNLILYPSTAPGGSPWAEFGSVFAAPATVSAAIDLPLGGVVPTAIQFSATGSAAEDVGAYNFYPFTTSATMNGKLQIDFFMRPGTPFVGSEWTVSVYQGAVRQTLSTDSGGFTRLPTAAVRFTTSFDAIASTAYTLRFARTTGTLASILNVCNVFVGIPFVSQTAAVGPITHATVAAGFTLAADGIRWRREGEFLKANGRFDISAVTATTASLTLPSGLTSANTSTMAVGKWIRNNGSAATFKQGAVLVAAGASVLTFSLDDTASANGPYAAQAGNFVFQASDAISFSAEVSVPIAQWIGSGTLNVGPGAQVEYASNGTAFGTPDNGATPNFQYGPAGQTIPVSALTTAFVQRIRFQYPVQAGETLGVAIIYPNGAMVPVHMANANPAGTNVSWCPYTYLTGSAATDAAGISWNQVNATDMDIYWGRYITTNAAGAAFGYGGMTAGLKWVAYKAKMSSPVGFGLSTGNISGLTRGQATFAVYANANQTGLASTSFTKISLNTEEFDTDNYFENVTNFRLTPSAGNWRISAACRMNNAASITTAELHLYKNGSSFKILSTYQHSTSTTGIIGLSGAVVVQANGMDFFELFVTQTGAGTYNILGSQAGTYMTDESVY